MLIPGYDLNLKRRQDRTIGGSDDGPHRILCFSRMRGCGQSLGFCPRMSRRWPHWFRWGDGRHSLGWESLSTWLRDTLLWSIGFGAWTRGKPELAVLNNNCYQCESQKQQSDQHPAPLLLFEGRVWHGPANLRMAVLFQHRHSAIPLPLPNLGLAA
jgi:hypothetical protein